MMPVVWSCGASSSPVPWMSLNAHGDPRSSLTRGHFRIPLSISPAHPCLSSLSYPIKGKKPKNKSKNMMSCCLSLQSPLTNKCQPSLQVPPSSFWAAPTPRVGTYFSAKNGPERGPTWAVRSVHIQRCKPPLKQPVSSCSGRWPTDIH